MKKILLLLVAILCGITALNAHPVDLEKAKTVGRNFVSAKYETKSETIDLQLVYTGISNRNEVCFYVFNVNKEGFVIVSADDRFRPIVGYSDEGPFETENMSPELAFYLDRIIEARTSRNAVFFDDTAEEWQSVMNSGKLLSRNGGRGVDFLCTTKWNQDSPYNLYAPAASSGPGGRCYAGCVATAMSQVMKYWDHPLQGSGSHSYYCYGYGTQSANFGTTTYDWEHMPDRLGGASQQEIEAVALLMYHCAVAVDMNFAPDGSGANSWDVPSAIRQYFSYSNQASLKGRDEYSLTNWQNMLKAQFDLGWPVYYSGFSNSGGHAFVCDGYTDDDLFHFNWGWGGSSDGWFVIDEIDYAGWAQAVFNFVPADVYTYMPQEPNNLEVVSHGDLEYSATLTWTNPTHNIHNEALSSIDQILIVRDGKIVHTIDNVAPGANMTYTDHYMPTVVRYEVYAVVHNAKSKPAVEEGVILGPSCVWRIDMTSDDSEGWNGGYLSFVNDANIEIAQMTAYSDTYSSNVELPLGRVGVYWNRPSAAISKIGFVLKDEAGNEVINYEGGTNDLDKGLFFIVNNSCGDETNHYPPIYLNATRNGNSAQLTWEAPEGQVNHYYVYRDNLLYAVAQETSYTDTEAEGFHNYFVTAVNAYGESDPSNVDEVNEEGACEEPSNFRYEMTTPSKVKLYWDAPQTSVTGYMLYRRAKGENFKRIKLLTSTNHTDNLTSQPDNRYEYAVTAYYQASDCESGYATAEADPRMHFIEVNKSIIPQHLVAQIDGNDVVLEWQEASMATTYNVYRDGERIAEGLTEPTYTDNTASVQEIQHYTVTGVTDFIESSPSNEVFSDWTALSEEFTGRQIQVYPNPTNSILTIEMQNADTQMLECHVFNLMGQEVIRQVGDASQMKLNLTELPDGTYFVKVVTANENQTIKVVKIQ